MWTSPGIYDRSRAFHLLPPRRPRRVRTRSCRRHGRAHAGQHATGDRRAAGRDRRRARAAGGDARRRLRRGRRHPGVARDPAEGRAIAPVVRADRRPRVEYRPRVRRHDVDSGGARRRGAVSRRAQCRRTTARARPMRVRRWWSLRCSSGAGTTWRSWRGWSSTPKAGPRARSAARSMMRSPSPRPCGNCRTAHRSWSPSATSHDLLIEPVAGRPRLVVAGGGHVAQAIARQAQLLDFDVTILEDRPEFGNPERFGGARVIGGHIAGTIATLDHGWNSFIVIATRGHKLDGECLLAAVKTNARYIGLLGSRRKAALTAADAARGRRAAGAHRRDPHARRPGSRRTDARGNRALGAGRDHAGAIRRTGPVTVDGAPDLQVRGPA